MIKIPGKVFPVNVKYLAHKSTPVKRRHHLKNNSLLSPLWSRAKNPDFYIETAIEKVVQIHTEHLTKKGDILVFLPGKEEVEQACCLLAQVAPDMRALPVYAALPFEAQCEIFSRAEPGVRKVVIATNIAETSITIDGILFVIDIGFFKESTYDKGIDTLKVYVFFFNIATVSRKI